MVSVIYSNKFTCCDYYMAESFFTQPLGLDKLGAGLRGGRLVVCNVRMLESYLMI